VHWLNRLIVLPKNLTGLKPVLILPLLGTLLTGVLMVYAGTPVAAALAFLTEWLAFHAGVERGAAGRDPGRDDGLDVGGPVNKAAYAFSVALISARSTRRWPL
jgi:PTS system fructose-specific IIC component